jgi:hypothetical protein
MQTVDQKALEQELRTLRRTGLQRQKTPLPMLEAVGVALGGDTASVNDQIKTAIDAASKKMGKRRGQGVQELLDAGTRSDRYLKHRRAHVAKLLGVSTKYLEETVEAELLEELAKRLIALYDEHQGVGQGSSDPPPTLATDDRPAVDPRTRAARLSISRLAPRSTLLAVAGLGLVPLAVLVVVLWPSSSASTPPKGSILNAETGSVASARTLTTPTHLPPQLAEYSIEGGPIFRACNLSTEHTCKFAPGEPAIAVQAGDVIEFSIELSDLLSAPVPYLKVRAEWQGPRGESSPLVKLGELEIVVGLQMEATPKKIHEPLGELGYILGEGKPLGISHIHLKFAHKAVHSLVYVSGSSALLSAKGKLISRLPDGIMGPGIALQEVGPSIFCEKCSHPTRYVNFQAKVVNGRE